MTRRKLQYTLFIVKYENHMDKSFPAAPRTSHLHSPLKVGNFICFWCTYLWQLWGLSANQAPLPISDSVATDNFTCNRNNHPDCH
uniref:Uncharacterized protein n=1 Tax=Anabas testudineus TaxID=64144 RepID=A0A3Q1HZA0_ANATE